MIDDRESRSVEVAARPMEMLPHGIVDRIVRP